MAYHPLDHVAHAAFDAGMDHSHIVGSGAEIVRDEGVGDAVAFELVAGWEHVNLSFVAVPASGDHVGWLYVRLDAHGEPLPEAVHFVSLRPDLIREIFGLQ